MTTDYNLRPNDSAVMQPALQVLVLLKGTLYRIPVDGNHRIVAREKIGLDYFQSYVVPEELERFYRVEMGLSRG